MLKIGITGGIGSGKSIVCRCFQLLGVPVYDSDSRAKWVMQHDLTLQLSLIQTFGSAVYGADNALDRAYLARQVFHNAAELAKLNALVHPHVRQDFYQWVASQTGAPYLLKEAALMFESNAYTHVDHVLTVSAPVPLRLSRTLTRDPHRTTADVVAIMAKQISEEERLSRSAYVLFNDGLQLVLPQVVALHEQFLSLAQQKLS